MIKKVKSHFFISSDSDSDSDSDFVTPFHPLYYNEYENSHWFDVEDKRIFHHNKQSIFCYILFVTHIFAFIYIFIIMNNNVYDNVNKYKN